MALETWRLGAATPGSWSMDRGEVAPKRVGIHRNSRQGSGWISLANLGQTSLNSPELLLQPRATVDVPAIEQNVMVE